MGDDVERPVDAGGTEPGEGAMTERGLTLAAVPPNLVLYVLGPRRGLLVFAPLLVLGALGCLVTGAGAAAEVQARRLAWRKLALAGGLMMSRSIVHRIDAVNATCRDIMFGDLARRLPTHGTGDDFDKLADNFNAMLDHVRANGLSAFHADEQTISDYLYTAGLPDPDLLIRTSGEMRVSNFLLWQIAYAEIYVTETLWPDFSRARLLEALVDFQKRERRYGGLGSGRPAQSERVTRLRRG